MSNLAFFLCFWVTLALGIACAIGLNVSGVFSNPLDVVDRMYDSETFEPGRGFYALALMLPTVAVAVGPLYLMIFGYAVFEDVRSWWTRGR